MKINHQLREQLYKNGFHMSTEAKKQEIEEAEKKREQRRIEKLNKGK